MFELGYAAVVKLTLDRIVDAGMATFAEQGYTGLSMRQVAERLDVHAGSLYYHVRNKNALLVLLADRVAGEAYAAGTTALDQLPPDAGWAARVEAQAVTLRATLCRHEGGPLLLAGSPAMLSPGALSLMERLWATLRDAGVPAADCPVAADTLLSYVTGFVLQEQVEPAPPEVTAESFAALAARFPLTMTGTPAYEPDEMFLRSVRLQCAAFGTLVLAAGGPGAAAEGQGARRPGRVQRDGDGGQ